MTSRLIQELHAAISRRDWSAVEAASNRLRDDVEETIRILAGTDISSLPNDYPLPRIAEARATAAEATVTALQEALEQIADLTARCEHDGGFDRETGPIGCNLGDKCLCIGLHPIARTALSQIRSEK